MSFLESIATGSYTNSVAVLAVLFLLAGFIIFVFPMLKENKELKETKKDLEESIKAIETKHTEILTKLVDLEKFHAQHESKIVGMLQAKDNELRFITTSMKSVNEDVATLLKELISREEVEALIEYLKSNIKELDVESTNRLINIMDFIRETRSLCESIRDKQSTLNGALMMVSGQGHQSLK